MIQADRRSREELLSELSRCQERIRELETRHEEARISGERDRSAIAAMREGLVVQARSGEIVACNPAAETILGLTRLELVSRNSLDERWKAIREDGSLFPGESHPAMVTLRTGEAKRNVIMGISKPGGDTSWISINTEPLFAGGDDLPQAVVATFRDITAERRAELELRASEDRFHGMFVKHAAVMLLIEPETGAILDANPAAGRFYGYPVEKLCHLNVADLNTLPPEEIHQLRLRARNEHNNYFIFQHRLASGELRTVEVHSSPIVLSDQLLLFSIIHDITERKTAEAERERLIEELQMALRKVSQLEGILPVCAFCKKIRDKNDRWHPMETYITLHSQAEFSHTFCPDCGRVYYSEFVNE